MKHLPFPKARNKSSLRKIVNAYPALSTDAPSIRRQYTHYYLSKGNPTNVTPLVGLQDSTKTILEGRYSSEAKIYGLNWISTLRNNHGLAYCPMCGSPTVKTLDHYLAKADYPEFYIFSFNLIPSCIGCNQKRSNTANAHGTSLPLLHPYFDGDILNRGFLVTDIAQPFNAPKFLPTINNQLTGTIRDRAQRHISESIDLPSFQIWATTNWAKWKLKACRKPDIDSLLIEIANELSDTEATEGTNSWTASFLRGLLNNQAAADWLRLNP